MKKIKIIGAGRVVASLLKNQGHILKKYDLEIYSKAPRIISHSFEVKPVCSFRASEDIVIVCASVCEKSLLKKYKSMSRETAFKSNISIINSLIENGRFRKGQIFVLTNPSELIAEYIFKKVSNPYVFSLGQEMDIKRYKKLLSKTNENIICIGQHYQYPIVQNVDSLIDQMKCRENLVNGIQREFVEGAPPFKSGAYNIARLLMSINESSQAMLSSYCSVNDSFLCGKLKNKMWELQSQYAINSKRETICR